MSSQGRSRAHPTSTVAASTDRATDPRRDRRYGSTSRLIDRIRTTTSVHSLSPRRQPVVSCTHPFGSGCRRPWRLSRPFLSNSRDRGSSNGAGGIANQALVDQWQRVTASATLAAGNTYTFIVIRDVPQVGGDVIYTSAWQMELNAVTSFIPPTAGPTPRVADGLYTARNILVDPPYQRPSCLPSVALLGHSQSMK